MSRSKTKLPPDTYRKDYKKDLLEAATHLFAANGYHGTSVDSIALAANCNKQLLYYYFGSKEIIYTEALKTVFRKLENYEMDCIENLSDTEQAIREILDHYFRFLSENPDFVKLIMWENLNEGHIFDKNPDLLSKAPILKRIQLILNRAKAKKKLRARIHTKHVLVLLIGVCFIHFSNRHTIKHSIGLDFSNPRTMKKSLALAQDMVVSGLFN